MVLKNTCQTIPVNYYQIAWQFPWIWYNRLYENKKQNQTKKDPTPLDPTAYRCGVLDYTDATGYDIMEYEE